MARQRLIMRAWLPVPWVLMTLLMLLLSDPVCAEPIEETVGFIDYAAGSAKHQFLEDYGIVYGGWIDVGITGNANRPADRFNGLVSFGDRNGEVQLNQLNFFLERAVVASSEDWGIGGRLDVMYGSDAIFTQAYGVPPLSYQTGQALNRGNYDLHLTSWSERFNALALPQAYLEMNVPVGNGLTVKIGHFYTPVGFEVVTAPDNFFYTHAYTMQYGEPFTHTGVLGNYIVNANWSLQGGAVTGSATGGWDGAFNTQLGNWNFIGGGTWTSDDQAYSLNLTSTAGAIASGSDDFWGIYSLVGKANWLDDRLHYVIQHDHGYANNVITANGTYGGSPGGRQNAEWYGIKHFLSYDLLQNLGIGLRAEWFRDNNGFMITGPARCMNSTNLSIPGDPHSAQQYACPNNGATYQLPGANYYALTTGLNFKPLHWIMIRPNVRYDFSTADAFMTSTLGRFTDHQLTFSTDVVITF